MDFPLYYLQVIRPRKGHFLAQTNLKKQNTKKYALVLVVACLKLKSEKCPKNPANQKNHINDFYTMSGKFSTLLPTFRKPDYKTKKITKSLK